MELRELLEQVCLQWEYSTTAYRQYLDLGKTFQHAQQLMKHNREVYQLLTTHYPLLPAALQPDALAITAHYDAWMACWFELEARINPQPDDHFVFANEHRFPREAARRIEALKRELAGQ